MFENLNLVIRYDKTNPNVFVFSLWKNAGGPVYIPVKSDDIIRVDLIEHDQQRLIYK